jgi:hypothetical protein
MEKAITGFDRIFTDQIVGRMAVIARSCRVVARFNPGVVLRAHDVAISAGGRVIQ